MSYGTKLAVAAPGTAALAATGAVDSTIAWIAVALLTIGSAVIALSRFVPRSEV